MGNCFGAQQVNTHSPATTKPPSPQEVLKKNVVVKQTNNGSSSNGNHNNRSSNGHNSPRIKSVKRDDDVPPSPAAKRTDSISPNVKVFSFSELRSATRNFRPDSVLGEGGFGRVFKGWVDEKTYVPAKVGLGMPVAVKKCNSDSIQGLEEWQSEVKFLGKFTHPNLVRLVGYCWEDREYLLVYEYMQKGSLENHLFRKTAEPISWEIRLKIALGAAKGLAFLHNSENQVIYRDFKASNILLDGEYNAKLSDFGLAKFGPANGNSHLSTRIMGTYGYAAPEYVATGHLYIKSDVYGFGVVLLEILTGLKAHDTNRPSGEHNLIDWAKPSLSSKRKLKKIIDPRLEDRYPMTAAFQASQLILKCLEAEPKNRPSMDDVLHVLVQVSSIKLQQKDSAGSSSSHTPQRQVKRSSDGGYHSHGRSPLRSKHDGGRDHHRVRTPDPRSL